MKQEHSQEALSAYADGELGGQERLQVEEHLQHCAACTILLQDLRVLGRAAAEEEIPPVPPQLTARIMRQVPTGVVERRRHWIRRMPLAAAASLAGAAVLWLVFQQAPPLNDPEIGRDLGGARPESTAPPQRTQGPGAEAPAEPSARESETLRKNERLDANSVGQEKEARSALQPDATDDIRGKGSADEVFADGDAQPTAALEPAAGNLAAGKTDAPQKSLENGSPGPAKPKPVDRYESPPQRQERLAGRFAPQPPAEEPLRESGARSRDAGTAGLRSLTAKDASPAAQQQQFAAVPGPRELVLNEPGREIRLSEAGSFTVRAGDYRCQVSLLPDRQQTDGQTPTNLATDQLRAQATSEIASLFRSAASAAPATSGTLSDNASPWQVTLLSPDGDAATIGGEGSVDAAGIRRELRQLLQVRQREHIEDQCGPLPRELLDGAQTP